MPEFATQIVDLLNGLIWGKILIWMLVGCGLLFTFRLGFIQFRHFGHAFGILKGSGKSDDSGISPFQALCTSLAARVGTGNVAGVAVAITLGGPGAVFWMWVIALVGMATGFVEATLAQLFKIRDDRGQYRGGPAYYMEKGLAPAGWVPCSRCFSSLPSASSSTRCRPTPLPGRCKAPLACLPGFVASASCC